ncbi:bifunctional phosphopantothenoylcysteine decarboxylase/phosphopantothenate--cysteine ligase CoaBC [bacterium]|nr:bifunctional phosphopantothenoylcysteine decarboxylase/phosphopantothenate--cysteine ligase CoaBC [bacterium]
MNHDLAGRRVLVAVGGGIAAYKVVDVVRRLLKRGAEVRVMMTRAATRFVHPTTFAAISGAPVGLEMFQDDGNPSVDHLELPHSADIVLVAPATADLMAKMAHGIADDLVATALLAAQCPVLIAPAMNSSMWDHPATQANLQTLTDRGIKLVGPASGEMAAPGEKPGVGRMSEPEEIEAAVANLLHQDKPLAGKRFVITAGRTEEPIDDVRVLTNRSSGRMGVELAREVFQRGAEVILVHGSMDVAPPEGIRAIRIGTAEEMKREVQEVASDADCMLYVAAVSDWRPKNAYKGKMKREAMDGPPAIEMVENPDIAKETAPLCKGLRVGFALEVDARDEIALDKMKRKGLDVILLNHVSAIGGASSSLTWLTMDGERDQSPDAPKRELASWVVLRIIERLSPSA